MVEEYERYKALAVAYHLVISDLACMSGSNAHIEKRLEFTLERMHWVEGEIATHDALQEQHER